MKEKELDTLKARAAENTSAMLEMFQYVCYEMGFFFLWRPTSGDGLEALFRAPDAMACLLRVNLELSPLAIP